METICLCGANCRASGLVHWFENRLTIWQRYCGRISFGCLHLLRKMCLFYLQFLLLLGLPLPDNVLYSCFPCCFLLRSLGRDSYGLLTGANWLLGSAVRQSIGAFRDTSRCICLLLLDDSLYRCFSPRFLLCCRTASGKPFCRCLLIFLRHIRFRRNTMLIIISLVKRAYFPHSQGGPIPNGILCRPGDFFFRIIAGRIRLLRLPVRRLFRFAPDKVSLHLLLSGIHHRLILPLPCLDFRQWHRPPIRTDRRTALHRGGWS